MNDLHGDERGWDVFLAALDDVIDVLSKTQSTTSPTTQYSKTSQLDHTTQYHKLMHHSLISKTMLRRNNSTRSSGASCTHQGRLRTTGQQATQSKKLSSSHSYSPPTPPTAPSPRNTNKWTAWADLRQDLESLTMNSTRGTSRTLEYLVMRPRIFTDIIRDRRSDNSRNDHHRRDDSRAPLEQRSARSKQPQPSGYLSYVATANKQTRHEIRAASFISSDAP